MDDTNVKYTRSNQNYSNLTYVYITRVVSYFFLGRLGPKSFGNLPHTSQPIAPRTAYDLIIVKNMIKNILLIYFSCLKNEYKVK